MSCSYTLLIDVEEFNEAEIESIRIRLFALFGSDQEEVLKCQGPCQYRVA
jgi:hypothetical protein